MPIECKNICQCSTEIKKFNLIDYRILMQQLCYFLFIVFYYYIYHLYYNTQAWYMKNFPFIMCMQYDCGGLR